MHALLQATAQPPAAPAAAPPAAAGGGGGATAVAATLRIAGGGVWPFDAGKRAGLAAALAQLVTSVPAHGVDILSVAQVCNLASLPTR